MSIPMNFADVSLGSTARAAASGGASEGTPWSSPEGIDVQGVHAFKDKIVNRAWKGVQGLLKAAGVTIVEGEGRLVGPNRIQVGSDVYEGRNIVLAFVNILLRCHFEYPLFLATLSRLIFSSA